jgi:trehalose/maltose hydrolase-like predicted phosphorylase
MLHHERLKPPARDYLADEPRIARNLLTFRCRMLDEARARAKL